jgi:hypothetical protein
MKKIIKYAYVVLAGVMAMAVTSCKDTYDYDGRGEQDPGAFLSVDATTLKYSAEDAQILKLTLMRTTVGTAEDIKLTCDNAHFQVPSSVNFSADESKKTINIPFAILGGTTEEVTISVADESATVYGIKTVKFTITRDFVWEYLGEGVYSCWLFGEAWPQPVYRGEGTQLYKLKDCIAKGYDITFELTEDGQHLLKPIAKQETGYVHSSYGMVSVEGAASDIKREGNVINLPMKYTVSAGSFGANYDTLELPE